MTTTTDLKQQFEAATLPCKRCDGTGITVYEGFTSVDGKVYPRKEKTCIWCDGALHFERPNLAELVKSIKGRKPGKLRSKRPDDTRAYFMPHKPVNVTDEQFLSSGLEFPLDYVQKWRISTIT